MADDNPQQDAPASIPQDGRLSPMLQDVRQTFTPGEDGSTWADPALAAIQQHANMTAVADANSAAGDHFEATMGGIRSSLLGMVRDDPTAANLALRLTPRLIAPMVASTGMADEDAENTHGTLVDSLQNEIAHTAVMRMADLHADNAHALLQEVSPYLRDGDHEPLGGYIDTMQAARVADAATHAQFMGADAARTSARSAYQFSSALLDPRTEDVRMPADYLQSLVRNRDISPEDKQPLFTAFSRLASTGDVNRSDPYVVRQMISDIANPAVPVAHTDIMNHVGDDLKYADAVMLHGMNLQRTPAGVGAVQQLGSLLDNAQRLIAPGTDRAGDVAYSRFVNWLLPSYRRTGAAGLNPASDNYLFNGMSLDNFRPSHLDAVAAPSTGERPSLGQLFAEAGKQPSLDEKINRLRELELENQQPVAPPSGNFFQRKLQESTEENG